MVHGRSSQIEAIAQLRSLQSGKLIAHWHGASYTRHINPDASIGGWVEESATVMEGAFLGERVIIFGNTVVYDHVVLLGDTVVLDDSTLLHHAYVQDSIIANDSSVYDNAVIVNTTLRGKNTCVGDNVRVVGMNVPQLRSGLPTHGAIVRDVTLRGNLVLVGDRDYYGGNIRDNGQTSVFVGNLAGATASTSALLVPQWTLSVPYFQ